MFHSSVSAVKKTAPVTVALRKNIAAFPAENDGDRNIRRGRSGAAAVAWQSTTSTSSCESGSEGLASTICHDRN